MGKNDSLIIIAVLLSCLSFVLSLFAFAPISYNNLEDLPIVFKYHVFWKINATEFYYRVYDNVTLVLSDWRCLYAYVPVTQVLTFLLSDNWLTIQIYIAGYGNYVKLIDIVTDTVISDWSPY